MNVSLTKSGDNSDMTTMVLNYPKKLLCKKVTVEVGSQNNFSASSGLLKENPTQTAVHLLPK